MPRVPIIDAPQAGPNALPDFRYSLRPDTGLEPVAQGLQQLGGVLEEEQKKADAARAVQTTADFTRAADAALLDPTVDPATGKPKGYKLLQGEDAFGARDAYTQKVQDLRNQYRATLSNADQQDAFDHLTIPKTTGYLAEIQAHAGNQAEQAQSDAYKVGRQTELDHAVSFADNSVARGASIENLRRLALSEAARQGMKATDQAKFADQAEFDANAAALNALVLKGDLDQATTFYAQVKDRLGTHGDSVVHAMETLNTQRQAANLAARIAAESKDPNNPAKIDETAAFERLDGLFRPSPPGELIPNNPAKPVLRNPDGSWSTEKTITVESEGKHIVLPTIVDGKAYSPAEAIDLWKAGKNPAVAQFDTAQEAEAYAQQRHLREQELHRPGGGQLNPKLWSEARAQLTQRITDQNAAWKQLVGAHQGSALQAFMTLAGDGKPMGLTAVPLQERLWLTDPKNGVEAADAWKQLEQWDLALQNQRRQERQLPTPDQDARALAVERDVRKHPDLYRGMPLARLNGIMFGTEPVPGEPGAPMVAVSSRDLPHIRDLLGESAKPAATTEVVTYAQVAQEEYEKAFGLGTRPSRLWSQGQKDGLHQTLDEVSRWANQQIATGHKPTTEEVRAHLSGAGGILFHLERPKFLGIFPHGPRTPLEQQQQGGPQDAKGRTPPKPGMVHVIGPPGADGKPQAGWADPGEALPQGWSAD